MYIFHENWVLLITEWGETVVEGSKNTIYGDDESRPAAKILLPSGMSLTAFIFCHLEHLLLRPPN